MERLKLPPELKRFQKASGISARRRHFTVRDQRFGTTCLSQLQRLEVIQKRNLLLDYLETLKMGKTGVPENVV
jgi:hypothetical protein